MNASHKQITSLTTALDEVKHQLAAIHSSHSWRMTAPFRAFKNWIRAHPSKDNENPETLKKGA
jgi:hypothetical protein